VVLPMRLPAVACLLAGCHAFHPVHPLHSRGLAHRSSLRVSSGSNEGASASEAATPALSVDAVDFEKLASSVQGEIVDASLIACNTITDKLTISKLFCTWHCLGPSMHVRQADAISD
jgi:hypothetical protein